MKNKTTKLLLFVLSAVSLFLVKPTNAKAATDLNKDIVVEIPPEKGYVAPKKTRSNTTTSKKLTESRINMIVILIQFPNSETASNKNKVTSSNAYTSSNLSDIRYSFGAGGNTNSLADYIRKISYGKCTVNPVYTFSPTTGTSTFVYTANHTKEYYSPYDAKTNPLGYTPSQDSTRRFELVKSAFKALKSRIPSNIDLDVNDDGNIDAVDFFVPAQTEWSTILWPHKSSVTKSSDCCIDGKYLSSYNLITYQYFSGSRYRVLTHEFLHTLGYPDMYNYENQSLSYNPWTMMKSNTGYPTVHERQKYGGWINDDEISTISKTNNYSLYAPIYENSSIKTKAYKIEIPYSNEYFLVEYRGATASEYESLYGTSGIVVSRIKPSACGNAGSEVEVYTIRTKDATNTTSNLSKLSSTSYNTILDLTTSNGKKTDYSIQLTSKTSKMAYFNLINHTDALSVKLNSSQTNSFNVNTKTRLTATLSNNCPYTLENMHFTITRPYDVTLSGSRQRTETILDKTTNQKYIDFTPVKYGVYTVTVSATDIFGKTASSTMTLYIDDPDNGLYAARPALSHNPNLELNLPKIKIEPKPIEPIIREKIQLR